MWSRCDTCGASKWVPISREAWADALRRRQLEAGDGASAGELRELVEWVDQCLGEPELAVRFWGCAVCGATGASVAASERGSDLPGGLVR